VTWIKNLPADVLILLMDFAFEKHGSKKMQSRGLSL